MSDEKKWTKMTTMLATSSLLLTSPWYVVSAIALLTDRASFYEWSVVTSVLSHVIDVPIVEEHFALRLGCLVAKEFTEAALI